MVTYTPCYEMMTLPLRSGYRLILILSATP
jgi:hypothetical protein